MKSSYPLLLLFIFMGLVPISFTNCCKCPPAGPDQVYRIQSLSISTQYYTFITDTILFYPYDSIANWISIDKFDRISLNDKHTSFSLAISAFACDCNFPLNRTENYITDIKITSKNEIAYTDTITFNKGEFLNQYFNIQISNRYGRFTIAEFLKTFKIPSHLEDNIGLYLNLKPSNEVSLVFDIEITLSDNKKFLFENQRLKVK